jgi:hypothetical protein
MPIDPVSATLTAASIGLSLFGGAQQDRAEQRAIDLAHKSAMRNWRFSNKEAKRRYRYDKQGLEILKRNTESQLQWQEETANRDYNYKMAIRDYDYRNQMRAFQKSEENYRKQLGFNNLAAAQAYEEENRAFEEIKIATAFQSQDLMVQGILEEGKALSRGVAGRSAAKATQSAIASYGRNIAILDESMKSAGKQHLTNLKKIDLDKLGADLAADAARMLKPEMLPPLPEPLALPRPEYQAVFKPKKTPRPVKGVATGGNFTNALTSSLSTLASGNWAEAFSGKPNAAPLTFG